MLILAACSLTGFCLKCFPGLNKASRKGKEHNENCQGRPLFSACPRFLLSPSPQSLSSFNVSVYLLLSLHHLYLLSFKNKRFPRGKKNTVRYTPDCALQLWGKEEIASPLLPLGCNSGQDRTIESTCTPAPVMHALPHFHPCPPAPK